MLVFTECTVDSFEKMMGQEGDPTVCTLHEWATGLQRSRILGLFHMPYFGRLMKANACANHLLECVHGGYVWLDWPVLVIVGLIS